VDTTKTLTAARRHHRALGLALLARDEGVAMVAAARLRSALAALRSPAIDCAASWAVDEMSAAAAPLLAAAPWRLEVGTDVDRLCRWAARAYLQPRHDHGPDVFELAADGGELPETSWNELHVTRCRVVASNLRGATFDGALVEECDFSWANLARTTWRGAELVGTQLAGAMMFESVLEDVTFIDCDLRGAYLGVVDTGARSRIGRATFLRCDLRETSWRGRTLAGVKLYGCKLYGVHDAPLVDRVEIETPDLSPAGDGSTIAATSELLRQWQNGRVR
jgi:hypothetical protein